MYSRFGLQLMHYRRMVTALQSKVPMPDEGIEDKEMKSSEARFKTITPADKSCSDKEKEP